MLSGLPDLWFALWQQTDVFSILFLNFHHFEGKTFLLDQGDITKVFDMKALTEAMEADQDRLAVA